MARKKADGPGDAEFIACVPRQLAESDKMAGVAAAVARNPVNCPPSGLAAALVALQPGGGLPADPGSALTPGELAVVISRYWGGGGVKLGVKFMDTSDAELKGKILSHANAWGLYGNVSFVESAQGEVRITREKGGGYWSYIGTDILQVKSSEPTMNLDSFTAATPDAEYRRVVRHEFGHTIGCPHEHSRKEIVDLLDPQKTIRYFQRVYGWSARMVQQQVLTPIEEASIMGTPVADQTSCMTYQLPGECTKSGRPIPGGDDITPTDAEFVGKVYPKPAPPPTGVSLPLSGPYAVAVVGGKVVVTFG